MAEQQPRTCLECSTTVVGRTDKKFCSDACRNLYHYRQNNAPINYVRNVINTLRRNRRILEELSPDGKARVHRDKLLRKGFDFEHHTQVRSTKTGSAYVFCFEYGYMELPDQWYLLVRRDEFLER
jgi:predicted nucleic acid-binding Zn ribbon protein